MINVISAKFVVNIKKGIKLNVMKNKTISPKITSFSWGHLETSDGNSFKDAKLFPGGSEEWDWNETGTQHVPGIQPADVQTLLDHDCEIIILSKGVNERLQTKEETKQMLEDRKLDYRILQTEEAISQYNDLAESKKVGALIHSTC